MTEAMTGAGNAGDAQTLTVDDVQSLADQEDPRPAALAAVAAAQVKVDKLREHLAGAEAALAEANAALTALDQGV